MSKAVEDKGGAVAAIEQRHGSIDAYLAEVLGVDEPLRARLHARLLG